MKSKSYDAVLFFRIVPASASTFKENKGSNAKRYPSLPLRYNSSSCTLSHAVPAERWKKQDREMRDFHARQWCEVRARFFALTILQKATIRTAANGYGGPLNLIAWSYLIRHVPHIA